MGLASGLGSKSNDPNPDRVMVRVTLTFSGPGYPLGSGSILVVKGSGSMVGVSLGVMLKVK